MRPSHHPTARLLAALIAAGVCLALTASPAVAFRGHVFGKSFGAAGSGDGQLAEPEGVAVNEATGDVYVVDQGNSRVEQYTATGAFVSTFGWGVIGTGASGTGDVTDHSEEITAVVTSSKVFLVGQTITGTGIPAGTTITALGAGTITLSAPATASGSGVALSVAEGAGVVPTNDQQTITVPATVTAGTYTLTFSTPNPSPTEATTANIPFNATASQVQSALAALANIGAGNVAVAGSTGGPYTVTFQGARFTDSIVTQLQANSSNLSGGEVVIATSQTGGGGYEICTADCRAGIPGSGEGQFLQPESIAVDNTCALHELKDPTHKKLSSAECETLDPSNGDVYVDTGEFKHQLIDKFSSAGTLLNHIAGPPFPEAGTFTEAGVEGVAVDPNGQLWVLVQQDGLGSFFKGVDGYSDALVNVFNEFHSSASAGAIFIARGLAVDSADDLYIRGSRKDGFAFELNAGGELLNDDVGGEAGGVQFNGVAVELSTGDVYIDNSVSVGRFGPFEAGGGNAGIERFGEGDLPGSGCEEEASCQGGVAADSRSGHVYVVVGSADDVQEYVPEPPAAPKVQEESVAQVTSGSATLSAEVNPRSEPDERPTSYRFEYTTEEQFAREGFTGATSAPEGQLPPTYELSPVSARPTGLRPGTAYRYRLVATNHCKSAEPNVECTTEGEPGEKGEEVAHTFTTQPTGSIGLPDGRGWELVSPANKHGALLLPIRQEFAIQAAAAGSAVTYVASAPTEAAPAGNAGDTQVLSWLGSGGWESGDLSIAHERATALTEHPEYPLFSADLSLAVVQPLGPFDPALSAQASEQTAYLRTNFLNGNVGEPCTESCYRPLVTAENVPGREFGIREGGPENLSDQCPPDPFCGPQFEAASPDLEHVVVHSRAALTGGSGGLFEWSGGQLTPAGSGEVGAGREGQATNFLSAGAHTVSTDGSRVVVKGEAGGLSGLLLRDTETGETVQLGGPEAVFLAASADDSKVFFTNEKGGALEECEIVEQPGGALACTLRDLTPGASVLAPIPGASEDGSAVYFASTDVLTGSEESPRGNTARGGQPNLYVAEGGVTRLIAVLAGADASDWGDDRDLTTGGTLRQPEVALTDLTARVSPDGRWLAFLSTRSLTGYDNRDTSTGRPDAEVYLYHASSDGGEAGTLICASCDPTGARPRGGSSVPGWTTSQYQSRYLSDGGRLFFDSPDALVPQDTNHAQDVYEYEPTGGGEGPPAGDTCTRQSASYGTASEGCVALISSGSSPESSSFLDASEDGDDVFFLTTATLSPRDTDSSYDVYDARVGGSEPEVEKPVECVGDACAGSVGHPEELTPGSLTFQGPGNLVPELPVKKTPAQIRAEKLVRALRACRKKRNRHERLACEKQARKKYAAKKASSKGSAKR